MIELSIIGYVRSDMKRPVSQAMIKDQKAIISVLPRFQDGLWKLGESRFLEIIYIFHLSDHFDLISNTYTNEMKGVFASHNPNRPSKTGISVVELIEISGNELKVSGLDALDGSPILDIKPYFPKITDALEKEIEESNFRNNPVMKVMPLVYSRNFDQLIRLAAQLHGHYCPWISLGVMMAVYAFDIIKTRNWVYSECTCTVYSDNGLIDGIQMTLGMTSGNGRLKQIPDSHYKLTILHKSGNNFSIEINQQGIAEIIDNQTLEQYNCHRVFEIINFDHQIGAQLKQKLLDQSLYLPTVSFEKLFNIK